jgi:hypothetical protein
VSLQKENRFFITNMISHLPKKHVAKLLTNSRFGGQTHLVLIVSLSSRYGAVRKRNAWESILKPIVGFMFVSLENPFTNKTPKYVAGLALQAGGLEQ